jgi:Putative Flp pilus-assembly TadE/G-like
MRLPLKTARRPGAVLPLVTVCLVGLMAFVAFGIDVGMMAVARTQAQSAADIAAMAGTRTLTGQSGNNKTNAEAEAKEAAKANYVLGSLITDAQVTTVRSGVYKYDATAARFQVDFTNPPTGNEAYGAMQVIITTNQDTYFGRVLGVSSMVVSARATAVHRPRDIGISLDFSGSMKFSSEFNYPSASSIVDVTGGLNPDDRFPRFGPWIIYPVATSGTPNPMHRVDRYVDSGGEAHAANNLTVQTNSGPAIVKNFQTNASATATNAFVYNGDLNGAGFDIANTPVCMPAPSSWTSQYATAYAGDRWPLKRLVTTTTPTVDDYAKTVAEVTYGPPLPPVSNALRELLWETDGYDMLGLNWTNGPFKGYSMGPAYYGKSFYIWPPDPRYGSNADPTNISTTNPAQDTSSRWIADWRKRFFLYPGTSTTKGAPMDDNSRLFDTASGNVGVWKAQGLGSTVQYIPNYDAILKWIKNGPQTLPPSLRAGRVLYYDAIPDTIPMNWQTGLINSSATVNDRFWKDYIDFVIGCGRFARKKTLYGASTTNTWDTATFGTPQITPKSNLTGTPAPYMNYGDCPVHPRLHMWFGPLTMLGFLSVNSDVTDYNWFAGTTAEAQTWQLKAGIRAALDDINKNHPNDLASLNFWSSHNGYVTPRVVMSRDFDKMKNCLYYPFSLIGSLGTVTSEMRPYDVGTITNSNPSGFDPLNYQADVPCADGGTNPTMGLMVAYNQFNWNGGYTGRKGAAKIVILETDGVANQKCNGTFSSISGGGGTYNWTSISSGGSPPSPSNGHPQAMDPAISLAWLINQDAAGSKAWPTFPNYTNGTGVATATTPTKWIGLTRDGPGFSTGRLQARVHVLAFGELFEDTTTSIAKTRGLEFLLNMQIAGGSSLPSATSLESYKIITGTSDQRVAKIKEALERIMQGGINVSLVE